MLTRWLAFTAFLSGSANAERAAITVAPTCRVKGQAEVELTLNCGDGKNAGVVQYWHSPFGDLQIPGFHSKLDPVFMHHDGSLVVPNTSIHHSGLYYCLLQHTEGTTLWPYELYISQTTQKNHEHSKCKQGSSCDAFRFRRDVGSEAERQAGHSDGQFAGAVAASVLLTFVLGFSAGALTRTHVLRCLGAVTKGLRSPRKQRHQTDTPHHGSEVTNTTMLPTYNNQAFEMEHVWDDNSANFITMETTTSSTTSSPPAKPQRSFRNKRQEEQETTVYLEGCDYMEEEERRMEEEVAGRSLEERNKGCDGETEEEEEERELGEDRGSQTKTDEEECSAGGEERDGRKSREEKMELRQEKEIEEAGEQENRRKEGEERRESEEETGYKKEKEGAEWREEEEEEREGDDAENKSREEEGETGICKDDKTDKGGKPASSPPCPGRRSRVIRLYQYDDDGQRYCHLPDPAPDEPRPTPRLRQRSVSLTRLNAIMAAASAGPLDTREPGREEREERPHFHMDI